MTSNVRTKPDLSGTEAILRSIGRNLDDLAVEASHTQRLALIDAARYVSLAWRTLQRDRISR